ncbi:unnamed protein product [Pseudo-nitzschia multistriata]|uniref:VWFA domain-containing protein n=1 Tax=Pseudo-nitzschia multistriata TaxID=183589 RepID=A0A448ZL41_9STRA|nr:unnamed protein product [Pseudo-nitzschia multistriata]
MRSTGSYLDISIDPLVARIFEDERESLEDESDDLFMESLRSVKSGILESSRGMFVWRQTLAKGRLPTESDFANPTSSVRFWPPAPLFSCLLDAANSLQLSRLALRHPETIPMILRSILRKTFDYARRRIDKKIDAIDSGDEEKEDEDENYSYDWERDTESSARDEEEFLFPLDSLLNDDDIARDVAESLVEEWSEVVKGVSLMDDIFGFDHDLLSSGEEDDGDGDDDGGAAGAAMGFGMRDGIWSHTGWQLIPDLQQQISDIPELNDLVQKLGRRPSAEEDGSNRRRFEKFAPRKPHPEGGLGAEFDPCLRRESVSGIALSGNPSEMLPSEAVLLRSRVDIDEKGTSSSKVLRRLFLAKMAESKLQSYELSGWADIPSMPRENPLYLNRLPSAPGGPIIVCLDTSWSMSGNRESLSKAVVLACVIEARRQGRECQVVSFSTERKVMETGVITANSEGIKRLLAFLSHSFGGGTDVTGALKFAIEALESDDNELSNNGTRTENFCMEAADILLVTDGEIPDPPVPLEVMESIDRLKTLKGIELHGLLIGKSESKPLSRVCTHTHDFLSKYSIPSAFTNAGLNVHSSTHNVLRQQGQMSTTQLYAKRSYYDDDDDDYSYGRKRKSQKKGKRKWDVQDEDEEDYEGSWMKTTEGRNPSFGGMIEGKMKGMDDDDQVLGLGEDSVDEEFSILQKEAADTVVRKLWTEEKLAEERAASDECWEAHTHLNAAVARVEDGLVERGEDARLVVLAMIANEHILLLGKPGTGKSILGLRLAKLCEGTFFQRLLTRFTTPEELFGPLSLKSLENDEYRRVTSGFLPTADIAFLDEIFKANSAILNTLLTILNERKFDNGGSRESCPMRCVVGASNELPDSEELVALYDRFLIRKEVMRVSDQGVLELLSMSNPGESSCTTNSDEGCDIPLVSDLDGIIDSLSSAADSIVMDDDACELMRDMRSFLLENHGIEISDRRLVKAARLLKISAASDGRKKVDTVDFLLLQHCFWNEPSQRAIIREWMWDNLTPSDGDTGTSPNQIRFLLENLRKEIRSTLRKTNGCIDGSLGGTPDDIASLDVLREESERIATIAQQRLDALARHMELVRTSGDFTWIEPDDASAIQQLLLPRAEMVWPQLKKVAEDAIALWMAISPPSSSRIPNELRESVIEMLWEDGSTLARAFTDDELQISSKEAKAKYDLETFRRWKRTKKKANKASK